VIQVTVTIILLGAVFKSLGPLGLMLVNVLVSGTLIFLLRAHIHASLKDISKRGIDFLKFLGESRDYFLYLLLFLFLVQVAATLWKIYYLPPHVGDVLSYHLHPVVEWFQQGHVIHFTDSPVWRVNNNPLGAKFLHLWFIVFFKEITWIELPQFLFGLLLCISSYGVMLRMGVKRAVALRYAVLIYFLPAVLLQSRTGQDHLILAACTVTALLYFIDVFYREEYSRIVFLALALAYLFGVKKHAPLVIFMLFPALMLSRGLSVGKVWAFIRGHRRVLIASAPILVVSGWYFMAQNELFSELLFRFMRLNAGTFLLKFILPVTLLVLLAVGIRKALVKWPAIKTLPRRRLVTVPVALACIAALGYGVIKTMPHIKPFLKSHTTPLMFMNRDFDSQYPAFKSKFMKNLLAFPFRIRDVGLYTPYTPDLLEKSGFGIQFFGFGLIAYLVLLPLAVFKKEYRAGVMGFLIIFAILLLLSYFFLYFSWANYRSFMFFAVTGLMLWAFIQSRWIEQPYYRGFVDLLLLVMVLFSAAACFFEGNLYPERLKTVVTAAPQERTTVKYANLVWNWPGPGKSWEIIDRHIAPAEPVGFSGGGDAWTFPYFDNRLKRKVYYIDYLPGFDVKKQEKGNTVYRMLQFNRDFRASLKQRGIHYIHFSTQGTSHSHRLFIAENTRGVVKITPHLYYVKH
jgi:hypothetical protein